MARTSQGGSILGFIVVGGVMALLLVGGVYVLQSSLTPGEDGPVAVTDFVKDESEKESGNKPETAEEESNDFEAVDPAEDEETSEESEDTESPSETPVTGPQNTAGSANGGGLGSSVSPNNLPETGVGDTLVAGLILSSVAGVTMAYLRSRLTSVAL